jgi:hypothetical protein
MTEEDARRHLERVRQVPATLPPQDAPAEAHRGPKYKSTWEARAAELLDLRLRAGEIRSWIYEGMHVRLPGDIMYRVDFVIQLWDGRIQGWEIKGRMREPARIKLRQAVERYPCIEWYLLRGDMIPVRLYSPRDVPSK